MYVCCTRSASIDSTSRRQVLRRYHQAQLVSVRQNGCSAPVRMARSMLLATMLVAICPTVSALVSAAAPGLKGLGLAGRNRLLNDNINRVPYCLELRASVRGVDGAWGADNICAAREALINSEDFKALVKRVEDREVLHVDDAEADGQEECGSPYNAAPAAPAAVSGVPSAAAGVSGGAAVDTNIGSAPTVPGEGTEQDNQIEQSSWMRPRWQKNAAKLENLRTTVRESNKGREIAASLRGAADSSAVVDSSLPRGRASTVRDGQAGGSIFAGPGEVVEGAFVRGAQGSAERGKSGRRRGPPGFRWIRNVASKVSSVGKRARGRVARVVGDGRD